MKRSLIALTCCLLLLLVTVVSGHLESSCRVTLRLIDTKSGKAVPGLIRIVDRDGKSVHLQTLADAQGTAKELLSRGLGLNDQPAIERWSVIMGRVTLQLPRESLVVEAFSGLDTELAHLTLDLTDQATFDVVIPLTQFYDAGTRGMRSANARMLNRVWGHDERGACPAGRIPDLPQNG